MRSPLSATCGGRGAGPGTSWVTAMPRHAPSSAPFCLQGSSRWERRCGSSIAGPEASRLCSGPVASSVPHDILCVCELRHVVARSPQRSGPRPGMTPDCKEINKFTARRGKPTWDPRGQGRGAPQKQEPCRQGQASPTPRAATQSPECADGWPPTAAAHEADLLGAPAPCGAWLPLSASRNYWVPTSFLPSYGEQAPGVASSVDEAAEGGTES